MYFFIQGHYILCPQSLVTFRRVTYFIHLSSLTDLQATLFMGEAANYLTNTQSLYVFRMAAYTEYSRNRD